MRALLFAALALALPGSLTDCHAQAAPTHATAPSGNFTFRMSYAPADAHTRLQARLANLTNPALRRRYHLLIRFGAPLFLPDDQIAVDATRRGALDDGLARWLRLAPADRQFDLLVLPDVDYFWPAEVQPTGHPLHYSTAFILHLAPAAGGNTTVDVLQVNGMARFGKKFDLLGRTGPKFYWDDRPVPPSPQAAWELIGHLAGPAQ